MSNKDVYVIVPAYNAQKYIGGCLESILNQTYSNITVIVVDDASSDNTLSILRQYADQDNRIICIHSNKNQGVAKARNIALDYINQRDFDGYLCFVDADDYIHPEYIQIMLDKQCSSNADIVWCKPNNTDKEYHSSNFENIDINTAHDLLISGKELLLKEEYRIMYSMVWGKLFKKHLWDNVRFPENLRFYEDGATTFKAIFKAETVLITDLKLYYYYYSQNSATRSSSSIEKCECGLATSLEKIVFYAHNKEKELLQMTYVGYANTILKNIRESDALHNKEYRKKMRKLYKDVYKKAVKCRNLGMGQKTKFIVYRFFPRIQKHYIKLKMALMYRRTAK